MKLSTWLPPAECPIIFSETESLCAFPDPGAGLTTAIDSAQPLPEQPIRTELHLLVYLNGIR